MIIDIPVRPPEELLTRRIKLRRVQFDDALVQDVCSGPRAGGPAADLGDLDERLVLQMVSRGHWFLAPSGDRGASVTAASGRFLARYNDRPLDLAACPGSQAVMLSLPAEDMRSLVRGDGVAGSNHSAPLRLLSAHLRTVSAVAGDLPPASLRAARDATVELVRGILTDAVDAGELRLAPALAGAAQRLADEMLTDPELSPRLVAARLNVSVRTLNRAFQEGEGLMAYVRRRRLDRALADLSGPGPRPSVAEAAARWRFADSSHLIRATRARHGMTPREFADGGHQAGAA